MGVVFELIDGPDSTEIISVEEAETFTLGRGDDCRHPFADMQCSRHHLAIEYQPPCCYLRDLGSKNGTKVNSTRIQEATLCDGDVIDLGRVKLRFRVLPEPEPEPEPEAKTVLLPKPVAPEDERTVFIPKEAIPVPAAIPPPAKITSPSREAFTPPVQQPAPTPASIPVTPPTVHQPAKQAVRPIKPVAQEVKKPVSPVKAKNNSRPEQRVCCYRCRKASVPTDGKLHHEKELFVCGACEHEMQHCDEIIPGYCLREKRSESGRAEIWRADETLTGRPVTVRIIKQQWLSDDRQLEMFLRGSRILTTLRHPHITECVCAGLYNRQVFMVMEWFDGIDADLLRERRGGRLAVGETVAIGVQVLDALRYAHQLEIVHRDIKPGNIICGGQPPAYQVKLTDFDQARFFTVDDESLITLRGVVRGTRPFMPPEQVVDSRQVDHRADIYAVGATLYFLLTGQYIYDFSPNVNPLLTIVEDAIVPIEARGVPLPRGLCAVINRAIQKDKTQRYQSAADMRAALQAVDFAQ